MDPKQRKIRGDPERRRRPEVVGSLCGLRSGDLSQRESPRVGAMGWRPQGREMPPCGGIWPLRSLRVLSGWLPPRLGYPSPFR